MNIKKSLICRAKKQGKTIVFPEAAFSDRIIKAAKIVTKNKIAKVILIADESALAMRFNNLKDITIISPKSSTMTKQLAQELYLLRQHKGMTLEDAEKLILDPFYFATMLVKQGIADGMVAGAEVPTATTLRPALQIIGAKDGFASSCFMFIGKHKKVALPLFVSDAGLCEDPTPQQLCMIAKQTADTMTSLLDLEPKISFLSYSTKGSASSALVKKVSDGFELFNQKYPKYICDGELQLDSSLVPTVAENKCPQSILKGSANALIVPDLNSGNILYKAIQYFGSLTAIGPIVQGLNKPVNDLSRGCSVEDIVLLTALTVLQCKKEDLQ